MRAWVCIDCGASGVQRGGGKAQLRCDRCRAGRSGGGPRKTDRRLRYTTAAPRYPVQVSMPIRVPGSYGSLAAAFEADLDALITEHPIAGGLGALALKLATRLDPCEDKNQAVLARELRATMTSLATYRPVNSVVW